MGLIAVDPGANGGLAVLSMGTVTARKLTPWDFLDTMRSHTDKMVFIEDVGYHVKGNNAQASCTFARHVGWLHGVLIALDMRSKPISAKDWQRHVLDGVEHKGKKERKDAIKCIMQVRYPHIKVTLATADALGILSYAMDVLYS